jgi:enamine deaminase RidA (YjgF/YER057c/UK114 family)
MSIDAKLKDLGIELPEAPSPKGNYAPWIRHGDVLYLSGVGGGPRRDGKVGGGVSIEEAYVNARGAAINHLAAMKAALGSLDEVVGVIRVVGYVNSVSDFTGHPQVVDGATDLFAKVFGDRGRPARAAVGMSSLPFGIPVEIETMVAVAQ